jgi:hypothetical protein
VAYFDVATGPNGTVLATWLDFSHYTRLAAEYQQQGRKVDPWNDVSQRWAEQAELRFARSTDGLTFGPSVVLDTLACICCRTAVAHGADGAAYLMWRHVFDNSERDFVVSRLSADAPGGQPVRVHADHWKLMGCPDIGPDLAVDGTGAVHAAWYTGADGQQGLHYASSRNHGESFGAPASILTGPDVPTSEVKLAISGTTPWLVWEDQRAQPREGNRPLWGDHQGAVRLRVGYVTRLGIVETLKEPLAAGRTPAIAAAAHRLGIVWADRGRIAVRLGVVSAEHSRG